MLIAPLLIPCLEILALAIMINYLLKLFWGTRGMDVIIGFLALILLFFVATWVHLPVLEKILFHVVNVAVLAVFIILQPEIRLALSRIRIKGKKFRAVNEFDQFLDQLTTSVYRLSEKEIGAIIVLENVEPIQDYCSSSVTLNAQFSSELLETIFMTNTPLHDGAVVIRGNQILSAGTILPLATETAQLSKTMGTRHRAGLGASQKTDALVIVISEETGKVSIARDGILTRGIKSDRFKGIIRSVFSITEHTKSSHWWRINL